MEKSISGFSHYIKDETYKKAEKRFKQKLESIAWENVNKEFMGFFGQIIWFLILFFTFMFASGKPEVALGFAVIYIPLWIISAITRKKRKQAAFLEEMKKSNYDNEAEEVLNIILKGQKEVKKLGKVFSITHNEITSSKKRVYFGEVLISLESTPNTIYIIDKDEFYQKNFLLSDIIKFQLGSAEGLDINHVNYSEDIERVINANDFAHKAELDAKISKITDRTGGIGTLHSQIRADKAMIRAAKEKNELKEKKQEEEKRLLDEQRILLLEFKDGDSLLISHLVDSTYTDLKENIERQ